MNPPHDTTPRFCRVHGRDSRSKPHFYNIQRPNPEEANAELAAHLIRAHEEERALIARELHDDIAQSLSILHIKLKRLELGMSGPPDVCMQIEDLCRLSRKIADDVQHLSHGLHSSSLDLLGLAVATRQLCAEFVGSRDSKLEFNLGEIPQNLDKDIALCIFRVLQESLRNIVKHSRAGTVTVDLSADSDKIRLQVCDDGVGFDPAANSSRPGLGLISMRERLRLVRGKVAVTSARGEGTRIEAIVPLVSEWQTAGFSAGVLADEQR